jgi:hypothetical protein
MHQGCLIVALLLAGCAAPIPQQASEPAPTPPSTQPDPGIAQPEPVATGPNRALQRLSIAAVGDMMLGTNYQRNHLADDDGVSFLQMVIPVLAAADIALGNLEGVLLDGGEQAKKCSNPNACYLFSSPSRYIDHYKRAGFDVLSLANNHSRDFGEEGRFAGMKIIVAAGLHHSGLRSDFATMVVVDLEVALLAFWVTRNSKLLHDYERARTIVASHAQRYDIVVVSFHGGAEGRDVTRIPFAEEFYFGEPRSDVVRFSRLVVDASTDLVLGYGPHVVHAMENYKDRLIAYSLGNFATYFGMSAEGQRGIAPILVTTLDGTGKFIGGQVHSTIQLRPAGPSFDPDSQALRLIRNLSAADFDRSGIQFDADGEIHPTPRGSLRSSSNNP